MTSFEVIYKLVHKADLSTVGGRLKQARLAKGLTIKELAMIIKVSEITIGRWEKDQGEIENHPDKIKNICKILEISPKYIFAEFAPKKLVIKEGGLMKMLLTFLIGLTIFSKCKLYFLVYYGIKIF